MAQHTWLLQRANRLQEACFNQETAEITDQKLFTLYLRYACLRSKLQPVDRKPTTHERAFHKCLTDLLKPKIRKAKDRIWL